MEESRSKRTTETNRDKQKKKLAHEKKTKSDTTAFSTGSSVTDPSLESIVVVGKGCGYGYGKAKSHESGFRLHECYSEAAINLVPESSSNLMDIVRFEGLQPVVSNSSFMSAKSDVSEVQQKKIHDLEDALHHQNMVIHCLKRQIGQNEMVSVTTAATETEISLTDVEDFKLKLKELEKKILGKEKKIKDLYVKIEDSSKAKDMQNRENKRLTHQVNLLNRQLKSMFELLGTKNWSSIDSAEFEKYKNKAIELEAALKCKEEKEKELCKKIEALSEDLESKEKELMLKSRELVEFKNKSTLEMCKLITQIDTLEKQKANQTQLLESKIAEVQDSMDEEIVNVTQKLEDQYQKDMKLAIDKFHRDFERLADLPKTAIEKLLQLCESEKVDFISFQKDWDEHRSKLEAEIESMHADRHKEMTQLKDSYETKVLFLKTQVEALSSQLKERKEIIDIFETELMEYKSSSSMNLLKASSIGDDISSLKELYTAELFSQKQVHKLQVDIFEEKVRTLTDEILYHAKNEEIHLQELENAKKMAFAFREKYEQLVSDWEERVEKDMKSDSAETGISVELDSMISEFKDLILSLKKSEEAHEQKLKMLESKSDDERLSLLQDIENFKTRLTELKRFQSSQGKLDETIQELISAVGVNYTKTVESLLMSHATELSLKQLEICASEKRHIGEIDALKNDHEKELEALRKKIKELTQASQSSDKELAELRRTIRYLEQAKLSIEDKEKAEELRVLREKAEELSAECIKMKGVLMIKEESEEALTERLRELENAIKAKEQDCREKMENLTAQYLKLQVLSSAKDDLVKEMADRINESEKLVEKSYEEVERLTKSCFLLKGEEEERIDEENLHGCGDRFEEAKANGERLKTKLIEIVERAAVLEGMNEMNNEIKSHPEEVKLKSSLKIIEEKNAFLEEQKKKILEENDKMKEEINNLNEKILKAEETLKNMGSRDELSELKEKFQELENEKSEILSRIKQVKDEKEEALQRNGELEDSVRDMHEKIEMLMQVAGNKGIEDDSLFSISLKEVRVLYEEEREMEVEQTESTATFTRPVLLPREESYKTLWHTNEELRKENESLRLELREKETKNMQKDSMSNFRNLQKELSKVLKDRDSLREEVESLRVVNHAMKAVAEKGVTAEDPATKEMNRKVERLTEYIRALTSKMEVMKANNEFLMSESHEHLRHNQNLVNELEEAWSQRYEIEDQLAKVRKENALLNLHRKQLEETNRRISSLVNDGKPSVVSWIKIHETVESIVDEVLTLKSSYSDSESVSGASTLDIQRTTSELKMMTETLHSQLKNKTMLCDELVVQKETLERELKNLETLLRGSGPGFPESGMVWLHNSPRKRHLDLQSRQPGNYSEEKRLALDWTEHEKRELPESPTQSSESSHLSNLNRLRRNLADQVEMEKAQFRENLKLEIRELTKEMRQPSEEGESNRGSPSRDGDECLKSIEAQYDAEVMELTKEFEAEVEKLKETFAPEKEKEEENFRDNYAVAIDQLKSYFEKKWFDLEKRYVATCKAQKLKRLNSVSTPETKHILEQVENILHEEIGEEEKKLKMGNFLTEIVNRHKSEVRSLREKYEEAVTLLEDKHVSEVQKLQAVVLELKENILLALRKQESAVRESPEELDEQQRDLIASIRSEYEAKLEEEKRKLCDSLEEARQRHEREIVALEEFWTEKLSECETRCAIMKATRKPKAKSQEGGEESVKVEEETEKRTPAPEPEPHSEKDEEEEKRIVKYTGSSEAGNSYRSDLGRKETKAEDSLCVSCLATQSIFDKMEVKTDDDKLDVIHQRDTLEEMVSSMRDIITKLLAFIGQHKPDLNNTSFDIDDTLYKSIHLDLDRTVSDMSVVSNGALVAMDLTSVFQEIRENSLLNSSDQVRFELERCLNQLKKDATCLLALSCPEKPGQNLSELIRTVEREKEELVAKVTKVEEVQKEMKREINMTKDRLSQWERNLEVVSEGYGEEIVQPKQIISLSDLKDKLKQFLTEHCAQSSLDANLLEEICKEGDRLQEEWKKEKCDLQQQGRCANANSEQIDVADKQVHSLKKFLEEQAVEREQEREAFDKEINRLQESIKAKERDSVAQNRTNREVGRLSVTSVAADSVETLETQVKELTVKLTEAERNKSAVEGEFQNAVKKIWSLREVIQDLEIQLAEVSERENSLKKKLEKADALIEEQSKANRSFKEELEESKTQNELKYSEHIKSLEEELIKVRHVAEQVNPESLTQLKANLRQIETVLVKKTKDLEQLHVSSANVSCSSPSEDVSLRDQLDATRCSTPEEMSASVQPLNIALPMDEVDRIHEKLARHTRAEEVAMKYIRDLKMQLRNHKKAFEEIQTERDVLLDKVDSYLKENSGLKVRLEEQRCNAGLLQKQLNANLESQITRLEVDVEKLNELCNEKDKQLRDLKEILENTTKSLKLRETEALNRSKEENLLITTLKTDLANALNENSKLEERLEKAKDKLRETMKMPMLIDSMLDEKNAEIDRLEKEVARLSSEKSSSLGTPRGIYGSEEKLTKKIRFSEPESFSENISSISVQCPSDIRNYSSGTPDFRNSSLKLRQPIGYSTKLDSVSSIAPLQLSPRGPAHSFGWQASSPICQTDVPSKSPPKSSPVKEDIQRMEEMSKLQEEIELKQREIAELHLQIDILKRQLVEVKQEVDSAKAQTKEVQNELLAKDEEIRTLKNNEKSLLMTIDTLKANHAEEVEEMENKLRFEHGKVEKVYEEIKSLEVKKIEIEESFFSLREDYNEKINAEKKTAEALLEKIKALEAKNESSGVKLAALEKEMISKSVDTENTIQTLTQEIAHLRSENEKLRPVPSEKANAETQVEKDACVCQNLSLETPETKGAPFGETLDELKAEFEKMAAVIGERDFNKKEAFTYAMAVRRLLTVVLGKMEELSKELESHVKKVMECSVDDLAIKVQKELVLSAKLDSQLLSSIEAKGFASREATPQPDSLDLKEGMHKEMGGGDNRFVGSKTENDMARATVLCEEAQKKISALESEKQNLEKKITEQQKIIKFLEENLKQERKRILEEKNRCSEDAKIMELLRVNLEKGLQDIRTKEKELKKEKQQRMAAEKELEIYKKSGSKSSWESKKITDLNAQLESQKEKIVSIGKLLEEERKKNQDLKLSLEEVKIERVSEKNTQRLLETDLSLLREQKQNLKAELIKARKLLHARDVEMGLLKRKINLQEIDIKALSLSGNSFNPGDMSSTTSNGESLVDYCGSSDSPTAMLFKMRKLNSCVQRHVKDSSEMSEALLYLSQEREQMRDVIRKLEENDSKLTEDTLVPDSEVERKLWALEKGRLVMDIETLKRENEVLKSDLIETCKNNEFFKKENSKLKKEMKENRSPKESGTNQFDDLLYRDRVSYLTRKYLRTESYRKALAWQKNYLAITLKEYERSEEALRKIGKKKTENKRKVHNVKFRVVALAVLAIFRMRFIVKRWKKYPTNNLLTILDTEPFRTKVPALASVFGMFSEPVDPLSYQTQNICRQASSHVLRTPPSRDPGPQSFSLNPRNLPGCSETYEYLQDNIEVVKTLPCFFECLNE